MNQQMKQFQRSLNDSVFFGVCGGIGDYFGIESWIIRLLFLIALFFFGTGVLLYLILAIAMPKQSIFSSNINNNFDNMEQNNTDFTPKNNYPQKKGGSMIGGFILIALGVIFLIQRYVPEVNFGDLWPIILIIIGSVLLINHFRQQKEQ